MRVYGLGETIYRRGRSFQLQVTVSYPGLDVTMTDPEGLQTTIRLDEYQARDLVNALTAWAEGERFPVGPAER